MRLTADLDLCQGHAECVEQAPTVFGYDEQTRQVDVLQKHPDESLRDQVKAAVAYCPAMALSMTDALTDPTNEDD